VIFHRLLDLLLALDLGLRCDVALLATLLALLRRQLVHLGCLVYRRFLGLWTSFGVAAAFSSTSRTASASSTALTAAASLAARVFLALALARLPSLLP